MGDLKRTELESLYNLGAASKLESFEIEGIDHVMIPHGAKLESMAARRSNDGI